MSQISLPITSRTSSDDNLFSDVYGNDLAIANVVNGQLDEGNFTGGQIPVGGLPPIPDATLQSPNNATYKLLAQDSGTIIQNFTGAGIYTLGGGMVVEQGDTVEHPPAVFPLNALTQAVANKTQVLRTAMTYCSNSVALGNSVTGGLYPITSVFTGAAGTIQYDLGTVITGSTVAVSSSAGAHSINYSAAEIALPAPTVPPTLYCFAVSLGGMPAPNSVVQVTIQLLTRNI